MPYRKTLLADGEIYHIYNRSIMGMPIFKGKREFLIFTEAMKYYLQEKPPIRFSVYRVNPERYPLKIDRPLATIINYCLMPNHFHFTLRQEKNLGIRKFIQRLANSFSHYYTMKYKHKGSIFEGNFRAVHVETDEQLIHLSRYIHLNPVTSFIVEKPEDYPYSSYLSYLGRDGQTVVDSSLIIKQFPSRNSYEAFVLSQKDYQRDLDKIKHLIAE